MSNNINNDLVDQNTSQQNLSAYPLETSKGMTENTNQAQYSGEFLDSQVRVLFFKNMYFSLMGEFLFNLLMVTLTFHTEMVFWLVSLDKCYYYLTGNYENCILVPSWLFYFSLVTSIILSFTIYFGGNAIKKGPIKILIVVLYLVFYGFAFSTICVFMLFGLYDLGVWEILISVFLIIFFLYIAYLGRSEISLLRRSIIIIIPPIFLTVIFTLTTIFFFGTYLESMVISICYGFYLILEASLIIRKGRLNLSPDDYMIGSLLLNGLMVQPLVRIVDLISSSMK